MFCGQASRPISTGKLNTLPYLHIRPINLVVYKESSVPVSPRERLAKHAHQEMFRIVHPHAITTVKLGGKAVPQEVLSSIWGFFILYLAIFVASTMIMASQGLDMISAFASVSACIFNVGPGLGLVGPTKNYLLVPIPGKWILIFCMLIGRLEIYTVFVLLMPAYWRK